MFNKLTEKLKTFTSASPDLERASFFVVAAILVLFPLLFVPALASPFDLPKYTLILLGTLVFAILATMRGALSHKITLVRSTFDLPMVLLPILAIVSALLSANKVYSLTADPILLVGTSLLFFAIAQLVTTRERLVTLARILLVPAVLLAILTITQTAAVVVAPLVKSPIWNLPIFSLQFNPAGSLLSAVIFMAVMLPVSVGLSFKTKDVSAKLLMGLIVLGLAGGVFVLYKNIPVILPIETGWKVATGTMGLSAVNAILGVGPGNYIDAFTSFKPVEFNTSSFWNLKFTAGANYYFYLLSTMGIAALATLLVLAVKVFQAIRVRFNLIDTDQLEKGLLVSLGVCFVLFALSPAPAVLIFAMAAVLGLLVSFEHKTQEINLSASFLRFLPLVVAIGLTLFVGFNLLQFLRADYYFAKSLRAAAANKGTETYNAQIQAINLNQWNDAYHASYSQTNLALADSLASQPNLTDQQKSAVVQLVQQSIREGRTAVALAPRRSANWENLSLIYRSLINFAQGADQWTVASLNQAIALDPTNPRLRLDLGGIYFANKDYASAAQIFNQAVNLKSDFANAHYNLAQALNGLNMKTEAVKELQLTASLICVPGTQTADCDRVNAEINSLSKTVEATKGGELKVATSSAQQNLPKAKTTPPVKISSPSGEITP